LYDILIQNATVIDGTGSPGYAADLAVRGSKIAAIEKRLDAVSQTIIDAAGLTVCPGFIDMHSHADFSLPVQRTADSLIHQGITTAVVGQCGLSPAPLLADSRSRVIETLCGFFGEFARAMPWERWASFADYLDYLAAPGCSLNIVPLAGQGIIRAGIIGYGQGNASPDQMARMRKETITAMEQGAIGLSTGLIYPPGSFTGTDELIELIKVVGARKGFYFSHIRGEGQTLLEAVKEAIRIGRETGASVQISHFKAARRENWEKSRQALDLIRQAQSGGLDVSADLYPYLAGSTTLVTLVPEWAHEGGPQETLKRLADPKLRAKMTEDMQRGGFAKGFDWDQILITSAPARTDYEGRYVSDLALAAGRPAHEWVFDALLETRLDISMALFGMSEENRCRELAFPGMMIGTDGFGLAVSGPLAKGVPHPRSYGTFPRVLGRYVRELNILTLEEAVWRMTGRAAQKLRLTDRGRIKPDLAADLVVFDPLTVADRADYENPHQYAAGIFQVIVNGNFVIRDGKHTGALAGRVLTRN
jgi:N-acyl-D-amino-acid deacylase